ncbi:hypothetical protein [Bacillus marinisedimentorum]|uniref:hypothetical protein n=1 Tax=Bacillus marinisedimentorum TaxID=1821260 RepID=UPI0014716E59|nr:hypothetical protein [Bacillus marinisedimentorum]
MKAAVWRENHGIARERAGCWREMLAVWLEKEGMWRESYQFREKRWMISACFPSYSLLFRKKSCKLSFIR